MPRFPDQMEYSEKYQDECYEYRHIILTKELFKVIRDIPGLIPERVWRMVLGIQVSTGWENYIRYPGEPHIILLRRPLGMNKETGEVPDHVLKKIEKMEKEKIEHLNKVNPDILYDEFAKMNL